MRNAGEADCEPLGRFEVVFDTDAVATLSLPGQDAISAQAVSRWWLAIR
jgi:hypothetical protein